MVCSFHGDFSIEFIKADKEMFANLLYLEFTIFPPLYAFTVVDISTYFSLNDTSFQNPEFYYDSSQGILFINTTYSHDMLSLPFKLTFNIQQSSSPYFSVTQNHFISDVLQSPSKHLFYSYSQEEYIYSQFLYYFGFILTGLALLICLIGIFSPHKLAGLEIMFAIQYSFVMIIWLKGYLYLPFYCLIGTKYSTGFNYQFHQLIET